MTPTPEPTPPVQAAPRADEPRPALAQHRVTATRISGVWIASILFALVLLLLLVFIMQNGRTVEISFLWLDGHLSLGVAMLLSAVLGVLLVVIPGSARIVQLRMVARRHSRQDAAVAKPRVPTGEPEATPPA
jgi:putative membrane protein